MREPALDPELRALRKAWASQWAIWRARRDGDPPGAPTGSFMATRLDEDAGPDRTLMCASAERLDAALREQRVLAARGCGPVNAICGLG